MAEIAKDIIAGTAGGISICLVGHPFDTIKVRLQAQSGPNPVYSSTMDCVKKTYKWEGIGGFYKGVQSPLAGQMFFRAIMFTGNTQSKKLVEYVRNTDENKKYKLQLIDYYISGFMTGIISTAIEGPIDLFKSQIQVQIMAKKINKNIKLPYTTVFQCAKTILRERGIKGCYQGLTPTIIRNAFGSMFYFGVNEQVRRLMLKPGQSSLDLPAYKLLFAGGMAGISYWLFLYPFDLIKSAMQGDAIHPSQRRYNSTLDCIKKLYKDGGIKRFSKGFAPCMARSVPANAAMWITYEYTHRLID
eukprot:TRINITY_DN1704_c0_g2_i2.p1 TRINITY_DN1704_c0_g2~~TRINITY_DN1704_c0_g2_i2.p1  ORF type:complete len:301 (-),score=72.71 TRINITY_DN1704_c0_g2_i2:80-982(-)